MTSQDQEMQILWVIDNPANAELNMDALRGSSLVNTVQWAKDGAEALDIVFGNGAAAENIA